MKSINISNAIKNKWLDSNYRDRQRAGVLKYCIEHRKGKKLTKEHRNKISLGCKGVSGHKSGFKWSPSEKDRVIRTLIKVGCARPNKFEINALTFLNAIYNNKFKYTGNGSLIVNHRSADAYSEELNTIALFNGIYWHLVRYGFKNTEQAKGAIELIESIPFLEAGYKVVFVWEDELNRVIRNSKRRN